jgi:hypothetical protein
MRVVKELRGKEEFDIKLNTKRTESSNTLPIWGMSRNDPSAEQVLYSKGVVLLNELEEKIGENRFLELCRARIDKKINSTADFLDLIRAIGGEEIAGWFEQSSRSR